MMIENRAHTGQSVSFAYRFDKAATKIAEKWNPGALRTY
jgi:hypothetical protein